MWQVANECERVELLDVVLFRLLLLLSLLLLLLLLLLPLRRRRRLRGRKGCRLLRSGGSCASLRLSCRLGLCLSLQRCVVARSAWAGSALGASAEEGEDGREERVEQACAALVTISICAGTGD